MLINNIIGHQHKGWSLRASSCSFTGEQSNFVAQQTLDDLYQDRVEVSLKNIYTILLTEDNINQKSEVKQNQTFKVNSEC